MAYARAELIFEERSWYKMSQWVPEFFMPSDAAVDAAAGAWLVSNAILQES